MMQVRRALLVIAAAGLVALPGLAVAEPRVAATIGGAGGTLTLPGYGSVTVERGTFATARQVELAATKDAETAEDWTTSVDGWAPLERLPFELRILVSGRAEPALPLRVRIELPPQASSAAAAGRVRLFAQMWEDGGEELLDHFESLEDSVEGRFLSATLSGGAITAARRADGRYEAIVIVGIFPP